LNFPRTTKVSSSAIHIAVVLTAPGNVDYQG